MSLFLKFNTTSKPHLQSRISTSIQYGFQSENLKQVPFRHIMSCIYHTTALLTFVPHLLACLFHV